MNGKVIKHSESKSSYWRDGVKTTVWAADTNGAMNLMTWEQDCDIGYGAPIHWHPVEEHLTFYSGQAEVYLDGDTYIIDEPTTVVIPPRVKHGFKNTGSSQLHVIITMADSVFESFYDHEPEIVWRAFEGDDGSSKRAVKLGKQ